MTKKREATKNKKKNPERGKARHNASGAAHKASFPCAPVAAPAVAVVVARIHWWIPWPVGCWPLRDENVSLNWIFKYLLQQIILLQHVSGPTQFNPALAPVPFPDKEWFLWPFSLSRFC